MRNANMEQVGVAKKSDTKPVFSVLLLVPVALASHHCACWDFLLLV